MPRITPQESKPWRKASSQGVLEHKAQTLVEGVLLAYPAATKPALESWIAEVQGIESVEVELPLFLTFVCGIRCRLVHLDPGVMCAELLDGLTHPGSTVPRKVAEVMVEAVRPRIEELADKEGWLRGPDLERTEVGGRPNETRGIWASAVLADAYLRSRGVTAPRASVIATHLAGALLSREVAQKEFYTWRKRMSGSATTELLSVLLAEFERLLKTSAHYRHDATPGASHPGYADWRARHRHLFYVIAVPGCESVARDVARSIPSGLWADVERAG